MAAAPFLRLVFGTSKLAGRSVLSRCVGPTEFISSETDTAQVYFAIWSSDSEPYQISRLIGIEPTEFHAAGSKVGRSSAVRKKSMWKLESGLPRTADIEDQFVALAKRLLPHADRVREISKQYECNINCAAYWHSVNPGFSFPSELIATLSELKVPIDFDLYCLPEEEDVQPLRPNSPVQPPT